MGTGYHILNRTLACLAIISVGFCVFFFLVYVETGTKQKTEDGVEERRGERGITGEERGEEIVTSLSKT